MVLFIISLVLLLRLFYAWGLLVEALIKLELVFLFEENYLFVWFLIASGKYF